MHRPLLIALFWLVLSVGVCARPLVFITLPGGAQVLESGRLLQAAPLEPRSTYHVDLDDSQPHTLLLHRDHFDDIPLSVSWDRDIGGWRRLGEPQLSYVREDTVLAFAKSVDFNVTPADALPYSEPAIPSNGAATIEVAGAPKAVVPLLPGTDHHYLIPQAYEPRPIYLVKAGFEPRVLLFRLGELDFDASLVPSYPVALSGRGGHGEATMAVVLVAVVVGALAWVQLVYRPQQKQMHVEMARQRELLSALQQETRPGVRSRAATTVTTQGGETFVLLEKLGQGAMGAVYRARRNNAGPGGKDEYWAVKTLLLGKDPALVQRFKHEIAVCSRLTHPGIVKVLDWGQMTEAGTGGTAADVLFAVMELVSGKPLSRVLSESPGRILPIEESISILLDTLYALRFAHRQGVIHRDIKPDNLMVTDAGRVKVLDFGVARVRDATQTVGNMVVGTPRYMSPEHFDNRRLTAAADVFSLGVVLHEMLCGRNPFAHLMEDSPDVWALLGRMMVTPGQSLADGAPGLPYDLYPVADKMIRVEVEERYQTTEEVLADLLPVARRHWPTLPIRNIEEDDPLC